MIRMEINENDRRFMTRAIELARESVRSNEGGPFGCVVVSGGEIVGEGRNLVTSTNDPTAHAEIVAIRDACARLGTFILSGCVIYTSCEPCPMCLAAVYWSRAEAIYFAGTPEDAAEAGFDDAFLYDELRKEKSDRDIAMVPLMRSAAAEVFAEWMAKPDKTEY